jgi:hypothetical protein
MASQTSHAMALYNTYKMIPVDDACSRILNGLVTSCRGGQMQQVPTQSNSEERSIISYCPAYLANMWLVRKTGISTELCTQKHKSVDVVL